MAPVRDQAASQESHDRSRRIHQRTEARWGGMLGSLAAAAFASLLSEDFWLARERFPRGQRAMEAASQPANLSRYGRRRNRPCHSHCQRNLQTPWALKSLANKETLECQRPDTGCRAGLKP